MKSICVLSAENHSKSESAGMEGILYCNFEHEHDEEAIPMGKSYKSFIVIEGVYMPADTDIIREMFFISWNGAR